MHDQVEALTFAEKVIVMCEGKIVQIFTPEDLFEIPEHTFVGYFLGSPGMNFLPCTLDGNVAQVDDVGIPLDEETAALGHKALGKMELGIRPSYIQIRSKQEGGSIPAMIRAVEDQGNFKIEVLALPAAYAFSRYRFVGDKQIFFCLLTNRMVPAAVLLLSFLSG